MSKNSIKAILYTVVGFLGSIASAFLGAMMWFSSTFLPVYINGEFVLANRILRSVLYLIIAVVAVSFFALCDYGSDFLLKKVKRNLRRR